MKNLNCTLSPLPMWSALFLFILLVGCQKNQEESSALSPDLLKSLGCHGFDTAGAIVSGGYIQAEGDILLDTRLFDETVNPSLDLIIQALEDGAEDRQYAVASNKLVSMTNAVSLQYYIDPSVGTIPNYGSNWVSAIRTAATDWTGITSCKITLSEVSTASAADIKFYRDNSGALPPSSGLRPLPETLIAAACFPFAGNPGEFVSINDNAAMNNLYNTTAKRTRAMRHEIGHILGLHHNQSTAGNTGYDPCGTYFTTVGINGTNANDPCSLMIPGPTASSGCIWGSPTFATDDLKTVRYMYPDLYNPTTITSITKPAPNKVKVTTKTPTPQIPYIVVVARYAPGATNNSQIHSFYDPNNGNTSFTVNCPSGTWVYKVWYLNYGTYGVVSSGYTVTVP